MPGRKPAPTALKIAKGVATERINFNEPKFKKVSVKDSDPPDYLDEIAAGDWNRVFKELKDAGVLVKLNRNTLAAYCVAYSVWQKALRFLGKSETLIIQNAKTKQINKNPYVSIERDASADYRHWAEAFGLTPSSQSRLIASDPNGSKDDALLRTLMSE